MPVGVTKAFWHLTLGAIVLSPIILRSVYPERTSFWSELAFLTGVVAVSSMVATLVLPSRIRSITKAFGINQVMSSHRHLGSLSAALVLAHLASVIAVNPVNVVLLDVTTAPARGVAATGALAAMIALIALAFLRNKFQNRYELWRGLHLLLTLTILVLAALHIWMIGHAVYDIYWRALFVSLAVIAVLVPAYRWGWKPLNEQRCVVTDLRREADDVTTIVMSKPIGFEPGQFAWLRLNQSTTAEDHPFTIASAPQDEKLEITVRGLGDWTTGPLKKIRPGTTVWIDGPYGGMILDPKASGHVMICNGVGITPMMSMLRALDRRGDQSPVWLIVAARTSQEVLFRTELAALTESINLNISEVIGQNIEPSLLDALLPPMRRSCTYYVSGAPLLVADTVQALGKLGIPPNKVRTEQFDLG